MTGLPPVDDDPVAVAATDAIIEAIRTGRQPSLRDRLVTLLIAWREEIHADIQRAEQRGQS